ncbi:MAG TPA: 1-acyl-sn-glycerol-3-phosphate acyltransferase [Burkholderiaceae bacterium]|nr:1-acyl-sn-glycerol-3-phosphate acyltransferase [Burkholderiaceae bacterium]
MSAGPSPQLDALTDINLDDLFDAAGLSRLRRTPLQRVLRPAARRFALVALEFDDRVGTLGLARGSAWLLQRMTAGALALGVDHVPATGPVVVLANHPGMTDTVALLASLASRPDLLVVALDRPFLRALPHVAKHLIFVADDGAARMGVVRAAAKHLKQGGALLTFPAGEIEPDPATFDRVKALQSLAHWSDSFVLLARLAPRTRVVPAVVSNVVSGAAQRHALTWLRRTAQDKERLAAALQVALPRYQNLVARVAFGPSQEASASNPAALRSVIMAQMRHLIEISAGGEGLPAHESAGRSAQPPRGEPAGAPWRPVV